MTFIPRPSENMFHFDAIAVMWNCGLSAWVYLLFVHGVFLHRYSGRTPGNH